MRDFLKKSELQNKNLPREFDFGFDKFGTRIGFSIIATGISEDKVKKAFSKARDIYEKYDSIFNRFDGESEVSRLNSKTNIFQKVSDELLEVVEKSVFYNRETQGLFDPRISDFLEEAGYSEDFSIMKKIQEDHNSKTAKIENSLEEDLKIKGDKVFFGRRMDFSGIVKGLVNDKVAKCFLQQGLDDFVVDSGGDIFFSGKDIEGRKWRVDVVGIPYEKLTLEISGEGIATSGIAKRKWEKNGKRKHHLINPGDPENFKFDLKTVTVIGSSTEKADILAKTLFLMGKEKGIEFSRKKNIKGIFLDYSGAVWISPEALRYKI